MRDITSPYDKIQKELNIKFTGDEELDKKKRQVIWIWHELTMGKTIV